MSHAVETMAYAGQTPWHGLGYKVDGDLTPEQMLVAAGLDWNVDKRPLMAGRWDAEHKATFVTGVQVKGNYALMRDKDDKVLSIVGSGYRPVQNADALNFFSEFVKAGKMTMDTAGSLRGGKFIWALAKLGVGFTVGKDDDVVEGYLLLSSPHMAGYALISQLTPICVVCWNTLQMALGESLYGKASNSFRMPHSQDFSAEHIKQAALEAMGLASDQMKEFGEIASKLAAKRALEHQVTEYFYDVLKLTSDQVKEVTEGERRTPRTYEKFAHALTHAPGQQLASREGTWWGALNAVTYVADHELGKTRDNGLSSAWLGEAAIMKRRATTLALEMAA